MIVIAGDEIEETADVAHHVHGRQHQDAAGRFGHHGPRALRPALREDRTPRSVRLLPLHRPLRQGNLSNLSQGSAKKKKKKKKNGPRAALEYIHRVDKFGPRAAGIYTCGPRAELNPVFKWDSCGPRANFFLSILDLT